MCTPGSERTLLLWIRLGLVVFGLFGFLITGCQPSGQLSASVTATTPTPTVMPSNTDTPTVAATQTPTNTPTPTLSAQQATATTQACLHPSPIAPLNWSVVLCDTFADNQNKWGVGDLSNSYVKGNLNISNGIYRWNLTANQGTLWFRLPRGNSVGDFYLTLEGKKISSHGEPAYGVVFRYDGLSQYIFMIREDQFFAVDLNYQQQWLYHMTWTKSSAIHSDQPNRLTVKAEGSQFTFYINDQQVHEWNDDKVKWGTAGIMVDFANGGDSAIFNFTQFEMRVPPTF